MDETQTTPEPTLTISLDPPVEVNGVRLAELTLREPTLGQIRDAQMKLDDIAQPTVGAQREYELTLLQLNSGKGRALIDALPARVTRRGCDYLKSWLTVPPPGSEDPDVPTLIVTLDAPLKAANGGEVHEITLREPNGGELRSAEGLIGKPATPGSIRRYQARLIELVADLPALVVAQIPITKAAEAITFIEGFERRARRTSAAGS